MNIDLGCHYYMNYNPRLDCFWIDDTAQEVYYKPQYVCVPFCPQFPIRHIAALYDGKPRDLFIASGDECIWWRSHYIFNRNTSYADANIKTSTITLEELRAL